MLFFGYAITLIIERTIGLYILNKIYPELRRNTVFAKVCILITYIVVVLLHIMNGYNSYVSNLYTIIAGLEIASLYYIFFRARYRDALLWEIMYQINLAFLKLPILIVFGITEQKTLGQLNRGEISGEWLAWSIFVDAVLLILTKKYGDWIKLIYMSVVHKRWLFWILVIFQWSLLTYNMWLGEQGFQAPDLVINIMFIICAALAIQCFVLYIVYKNRREKDTMLDTTQNLVQNYNYALEEMYNRNNLKLHDVRHHMLCIAGCLDRQDINKAKEYIEEYLQDLREAGHQVWTGFKFLDFVVNYKKIAMDEKNIAFSYDFALYEYPLEDGEMGVVLGNLLDNAIEAAQVCELDNRKIYMCLKNVNQMFMLNIKNSIAALPTQEEKRFITTKADKNAHGLGVENVKRIVEKYNGIIEFQYDNEQFEVTILI